MGRRALAYIVVITGNKVHLEAFGIKNEVLRTGLQYPFGY